MAVGDVLKADLKKGLNISGPSGGSNAPASRQVKCGHVSKNVTIVDQVSRSSCAVTSPGMAHGMTVTAATDGNCYWLPWGSWKAYYGRLGANCDYFLTANLTGCAFFVSGPATAPTVVHANCSAAEVVDYVDVRKRENGPVDVAASMKVYNDNLDAARLQYYGQVAGQMVEGNFIPSANLQMLLPSDYGAKISEGYAQPTSVFGKKNGANWEFFYNVGKSGGAQALTRMLYPRFEKL